MLHRVEPVDHLETEEGELVLYERELVALNPLASVVFALCAQPTTMEALAVHLAEVFGAPDGVSVLEATRDIVDQLVARGVLTHQG